MKIQLIKIKLRNKKLKKDKNDYFKSKKYFRINQSQIIFITKINRWRSKRSNRKILMKFKLISLNEKLIDFFKNNSLEKLVIKLT